MEEYNVADRLLSGKGRGCKLVFAIVVYRERYFETVAFNSLKQFTGASDTPFQVYIYDNTDYEDWDIARPNLNDQFPVYYYWNKANPGIAVAYNHMAKWASENAAEWIVLMDQDTSLPKDAFAHYLNAVVTNPGILVKIPVIIVEEKVFSPFKVFLKRSIGLTKVSPGCLPLKKYAFINSGMAIKISLFFDVDGYDECVKLDFADFLFIDRLKKKINVFEVLGFSCRHDFSHSEKDIKKALVRYRIFTNDIINCPRFSFKDSVGYFVVGLMHLTKLTLKFRSTEFYNVWLSQKRLKRVN